MATNSTFLDTQHVLRKQWDWVIVDQDGEIEFARTYNPSIRRQASFETLDETHGEAEVTVERVPMDEKFFLSLGARETLSPTLRNYFRAENKAPTLQSYRTLRAISRIVSLKDLNERRLPFAAGIPQTHDNTTFPRPGTPVLASGPGAGTFTAVNQYGWIVPAYINPDRQLGIKAADFTLANFASFTRGVHYTLGTPSLVGLLALGAPDDINVTWSDAGSGPRPTHYLVVISTVNDITNAAAKVSAITAYTGSGGNTTPTAPGATSFGAAPSLSDLLVVQNVTNPSGTRVFGSALSSSTDYAFDKTTTGLKRVSTGTIPNGGAVRITVWHNVKSSEVQKYGATEVSQLYKYLRGYNVRSNGTDPATRVPTGEIIDLPRVNLAKLAAEVLSNNDTGYHGVFSTSDMEIELDASVGSHVVSEHYHDNLNLIDFFSGSVSPAARPVAW